VEYDRIRNLGNGFFECVKDKDIKKIKII